MALGVDLASGELRLPFWLYIDSPHAGGSIFAGLSSVPVFFVLGDIFVVAKICALIISGLTLVLIYRLIRRELGTGGWLTAAILAPLFVLSTPHQLQVSVGFVGNTLELGLIAVLMTGLHLTVLRSPRPQWWHLVAMGLLSGLGLWIQLGNVAIIGTVLLIWFINDRLFFTTRQFAVFALAAMVGFTPHLIYNITYDFAPMLVDRFAKGVPVVTSPLEVVARVGHLLAVDIPRSFHFFVVGPVDGRVQAYLYYAVMVAGVAWSAARSWRALGPELAAVRPLRRRPARPLVPSLLVYWLIYLGVVLFIIGLSSMPLGLAGAHWNSLNPEHEHYLSFIMPILSAVTATGLLRMIDLGASTARRVGIGAALLATATALPGFVLMTGEQVNPQMFRPYSCVCNNVRETGMTFRAHPQMMLRLLAELDPVFRPYLLQGAAFGWHEEFCDLANKFPPEQLNATLAALTESQRRSVFDAFFNAPTINCTLPAETVHQRLRDELGPEDRLLFDQQKARWQKAPAPMGWRDCFDNTHVRTRGGK